MTRKEKIVKILLIALWVILFAGAGVLLGFANYEHNSGAVSELTISMNYGQADVLVTREDIDSLILTGAGRVPGKALWELNTEKIEGPIRKQSYVEDANVYVTNNGKVFVDVVQRQPVLRVITLSNTSFYIDGHGQVLPINPNFPARVLVASGNISDSCIRNAPKSFDSLFADSTSPAGSLSSLFRLAIYISNDPFFRSQISQIYVNDGNGIELIPVVGNHVILFGKAEDMDEKFSKLFAFYKYGLNRIGWNKYDIINIKYKNQVVCSKL
jgi:cell division protein FtsQ